MSPARNHITKLGRDSGGSVVIEFALIGPTMLAMLLAVLQFGIGMQNYNAVRSVTAEVARYAVINAQDAAAHSDMTMRDTNTELAAYAREIASAAPYGLQADRITVTVTSVPTRVDGSSERTITVQYNIPSFLGIIGIDTIPVSYSRPVFIV